MNALGRSLREMIASEGPIAVERFMAMALGHPLHGYYMTRDPFGVGGDFVTAPEISQMFGELLGVWAGDVWRRMGAPSPLRLIELGPGRGALIADFLRAARVAPGFLDAIDLHLVETSPVLVERQRKALAHAAVAPTWRTRLEDVPEGPAIVLANEFFDALPVRQYVRGHGGWRERLVGLDAKEELIFAAAPEPEPAIAVDAPEGALLEVGVIGQNLAAQLARRLVDQGGCALVVDYGHVRSGFGDTLQALRAGAPADPLLFPGEADLTAHVDFAALARVARAAGAALFGPIEQGCFLRNLGISERAASLARRAQDSQRAAIQAALVRLTDRASPTAMGALFKALCFASPNCPAPAGFELS
jgi:NADH dehydrogenase [ubiquinone] 1 alpha subcomplex assembly factor 7